MRREDGAASAFVAVVALAVILVAGLVHDGGRLLAARRQADDIAGNAARAGAQALDPASLRAGEPRIDPVAAAAAVRAHLALTPARGRVRTAGDTVTVDVDLTVAPGLLAIAGVGATTVRATRSARAVRGITAGGT